MLDEIEFCLTAGFAMAKTGSKSAARGPEWSAATAAGRTKSGQRRAKTGQFVISRARFEAVMQAAEQSGLLSEKSGRIGGRVSPALVYTARLRIPSQRRASMLEARPIPN